MKEITYSRFMPDTLTPEVALGAVLEKAPTRPGARRTPDQLKADELRERMNSGAESTESLLESLQKKPTDGKAMTEAIDKTFDDDPTDPASPKPKAEVQALDQFARNFLDNGFDSLDAAGKAAASAKVLEMLDSWDKSSDFISGMSDRRKAEMVQRILQDPEFIKFAKERYGKIPELSPSEMTSEEEDALGQKEDAVFDAQWKAKKAESKMNKLNRDLQEARALLDRYTNTGTNPDGSPIADKQAELDAAIADVPADPNHLPTLEQQSADLTKQINDLEAALKNLKNPAEIEAKAGHIAELREELSGKTTAIEDYKKKVKKRDDLLTEKNSLPGKIEQLELDRDEASSEALKETRAWNVASADLEESILKVEEARRERAASRTGAQGKIKNSLDNLLSDSAREWLGAKIKAAQTAQAEMDVEKLAQTNETFNKAVLSQLNTRYENKKGKIRKRSAEAAEDFSILATRTNGPKELLEGFLIRAGYQVETPPGSGNFVLSAEGQEKMKDKEFVDSMSKEIGMRVIRERMKNGRLDKNEVRVLHSNPETRQLLVDAIAAEKSCQEAIGHMARADGFKDKVKWLNDKAKSPLGLATLFLLLGPLPVGALWLANRSLNSGGGHAPAH